MVEASGPTEVDAKYIPMCQELTPSPLSANPLSVGYLLSSSVWVLNFLSFLIIKAVSVWLQRRHPLHFEVAIYCWGPRSISSSSPGNRKSLVRPGYNLWLPHCFDNVSSRECLVPCIPCLPASGSLCSNSAALPYPGNKELRGALFPHSGSLCCHGSFPHIFFSGSGSSRTRPQVWKLSKHAINGGKCLLLFTQSLPRQPCSFQRRNKLKSIPHFLPPKKSLLLLTHCIISYCSYYHKQKRTAKQMCYLTVLEVKSLKQSYGAKIKVSARLCSF